MSNECPHCNTLNPPQAVTCRVCNLTLPRTNAPSLLHTTNRPKMAVFDLDKTLFDLSRRERAARRQGLKEGSNQWYEFLNQNKYILMDTPMPGTVSFVKQLSDNGFTIAYLSGRPRHTLAATKQSLQENGFPIDAAEQDLVFLHSGKGSIKNITSHKKTVLTHLKNSFDIDFFFDDTPEFRQAAKSLFIPGVYSCISSYTGNETRTSAPKKKGRSKKARKNPASSFAEDFAYEQPSLQNPVPKPRKKRDKAGRMRKEPLKKYIERFMGDKKMNKEFPDRSQRFAVAATTARKFYGDKAVDKAYPRDNPLTLAATEKELSKQADELWASVKPVKPSKKLQTNLLKFLKAKTKQNAWGHITWKQEPTPKQYEAGLVSPIDSKMTYGQAEFHSKWSFGPTSENLVWLWNIANNPDKKALSYLTNYLDEAGYFLHPPAKGGHNAGQAAKSKDFLDQNGPLRDRALVILKADYAKLLSNLKWLGQEKLIAVGMKHRGVTMGDKKTIGYRVAELELSDLNITINDPDELAARSNPRSNPHTPVSDAKEFYKQFHQKPAKNVKKTKVDIGDTWVGLGKAWSIGYRSGKETGNEAQKYIHNFGVDEESGKQFNEPDLYYVKNNDGSQMMVIMGGDWYIDVDEEGQMSWIYI